MDTHRSLSEMESLSQRIDELAREKQKFQDLVEGSIQGILIHQDWKPVFVNQSFAHIFGYGCTTDMLSLESLDPLIAPSERPRIRKNAEDRLKHRNPPAHYEFEGLKRDGTRIWVESESRLIEWNLRPALQVTAVDITDRMRAEEELRAGRRLLQTVLDTIPHWVFLKDRKSRFMMVNRAFAASHNAQPTIFPSSSRSGNLIACRISLLPSGRVTVYSGRFTRLPPSSTW